MTKSPQRARSASKAKPVVRQRKIVKRPSESPRPDDAALVKTDVSPEDFFKAWSRKEREALVELLIESFDAEAGDPDLEPSLGFRAGEQFVGRGCEHGENSDDREVEDEHDEEGWDREGDELEQGGDEHDGCEPDAEGEPSLGWTIAASEGRGAWGSDNDREADGSYVTEAARQRYKPFDRYGRGNADGMHVDVERGFGRGSRRLINLSDQQREAIVPRICGGEVRV